MTSERHDSGAATPSPLEDVDLEDWASVLATNLTGTFLCTRQAFRLMKRQAPRGGRIINNGSVSASMPRPGRRSYARSGCSRRIR